MPRKRKERFDYSSLQLSRTVGLEIEGYMRTNPRTVIREGGIPYCDIKRDGSLRNYHWSDDHGMYGVEIVTEPLRELAPLKTVFENILRRGWLASGRAGLHIHVDASDFTFRDKLKFVKFAKSIEDVMFLFVKNRRYNNRYCRMIPQGLVIVAEDSRFNCAESYSNMLYLISNRAPQFFSAAHMDRYHWLNIFNSSHNTIEFRLFHPIRSAEDGAMFAYLVHNLVTTVKNASQAQLDFIAQSVDEESNIQLKARKFLDSIGVPYDIPIINDRAINAIVTKQAQRARAALISV
jgi:hypothetical protein